MRLRWPFSPARRGKAIVESDAKNGRRGRLLAAAPGGRAFRMTPWAKKAVSVQLDGLSPLPVEEKSVSGLPSTARDGLFSLPVNEKVVSVQLDGLSPLPVEEKSIRECSR